MTVTQETNTPMTLEEIKRRQKLDQHYIGNVILTESIIPGNPMIVSFKEKFTYQPKKQFISSITQYTVEQQQNYADNVPKMRVWYSGPTTRAVRRTFADAGFLATKKESNNWNVCWGSPKTMDFYETLGPGQICNQIPGSNAMGRKDQLAEFMLKAAERHPGYQNMIPKTFILPKYIKELEEDMLTHLDDENVMYIYKPALGARGEGIEILGARDEVPISINDKHKSAVVQHYIMNPLLINGFKFDMRIYALVTSVDPYILYIYEEGLGRFATEKFIKPNITNKNHAKMHLTNFSINGQSDEGPIQDLGDGLLSKWKLTELLNYLDKHRELFDQENQESIIKKVSNEPGALKNELWQRIQDLVSKVMIATEPRMYNASQRLGLHSAFPRRNFGLYGFDIMLTDLGELKLIEVNSSPATGTSTQLDVQIKFELLRDLMHIIGVPCYLDDKQEIIHPRRLVPKTEQELLQEKEEQNKMLQYAEVAVAAQNTQLDAKEGEELMNLNQNPISQQLTNQTQKNMQQKDIQQQQPQNQNSMENGFAALTAHQDALFEDIQSPQMSNVIPFIVPPNRFISEFVVFDGEEHFSRTTDQLRDQQGNYVKIDVQTLTRFEQRCLWQILDEEQRLGRFFRLLPSPKEEVGLLFEARRYLSELCSACLKTGVTTDDLRP